MKKEEFALRLKHACDKVTAAEDMLTEIDSKFGDADHGLTMAKIAGAIAQAVEEAEGFAESGLEIIETADLPAAVAAAQGAAVSGDVVVLSPACAAFDQFKNFMERGKVFKELVNAL